MNKLLLLVLSITLLTASNLEAKGKKKVKATTQAPKGQMPEVPPPVPEPQRPPLKTGMHYDKNGVPVPDAPPPSNNANAATEPGHKDPLSKNNTIVPKPTPTLPGGIVPPTPIAPTPDAGNAKKKGGKQPKKGIENSVVVNTPPPTPVLPPTPPPPVLPEEVKITPKNGDFKFAEETHNFGEVPEGPTAECDFEFSNTGTDSITIVEAHGSCGCTVPTYPKEPIPPGKTGKIHVVYNTDHRAGPIMKDVTIKSDAKSGTKVLHIAGTVKAKTP
ncbi:MAG: DUF1573 domain-containing protein [Chitinophagia bacterium]|nr:DUF1573 domain-containing protein [Chitinophagia bacterium]